MIIECEDGKVICDDKRVANMLMLLMLLDIYVKRISVYGPSSSRKGKGSSLFSSTFHFSYDKEIMLKSRKVPS